MKQTNFNLIKYDADEGFLFDWKEPHFIDVEGDNGETIQKQEHLYAKTLFIGSNDSIDNYIEVKLGVAE